MWDLIVSVPDQCLSFYFDAMSLAWPAVVQLLIFFNPGLQWLKD